MRDDDARARRGRGRTRAAGHGGRLPVRSARRGLRHRPVDRVAHAARVRATPSGMPSCCEMFGVPRTALPEMVDSAGELGALRHDALAGRAAAARARGGPAGGAGRRRLRGGRARQGDLRHRRVRARQRRRQPARAARAGCCRRSRGAIGGRVEYALDGGVFTAGRAARVALRDLGLAADPPALARWPPASRTPAACGCCPRWPASARPGGSPTAHAVIAGLAAGRGRPHRARGAGGDRVARGGHRRGRRATARPSRCCGWTAG